MTVTLANAPVSYGVFELTVGTDRYLPPPERVLDEVAAAGYAGVDLGPVGYLGSGSQLADRLVERALGLAGGYIELPLSNAAALDGQLPALDGLLLAFDAVRGQVPGPMARPTLAAAGSEAHRRRPGQAQSDRSMGLDDPAWRHFALGLNRVVSHCRDRGYEPTFHHHAGTDVEAPREIERVLELSNVGLCLDTGHLMVGGGDPVMALRQWASRINHVHLKDVHLSTMADIVAAGGAADEIWTRGVFCPLGKGDLDLEGLLTGLRSVGYEGWVVVEQDVIAEDARRFEQAVKDQRANRRLLQERGI